MHPQPLLRRTILDCSSRYPGPWLAKLLLDLGARVIKIEDPEFPDEFATTRPHWYEALNRGKERLFLKIKGEDQNRFHELVRKADGLIEGYRPSVKKKLGLDSEALHRIQPKLAIASIVGYPSEHPHTDRPGHDLNFQAISGLLSLSSELSALPWGAVLSGYQGALSLVAAIDAISDGRSLGVCLEISVLETLKSVQAPYQEEFARTGLPPLHGTTLTTGAYPCYRIYQDREGRGISVAATESRYWQEFCQIIGAPELGASAFATGEEAQKAVARIQERLGSRAWEDWAPVFDAKACCVEPVLGYPEVYPHGVQP